MRCWPSLLIACALLGLPAAAGATGRSRDTNVAPTSTVDAAGDWSRQGEPRRFTPRNLYEYIDGAADLFLAYGFQGLETATYVKGSGSITVDIYDMGAPLHAFGIFRSEKSTGPSPLAIGAEGYASDGLLAFWKGRYYAKIAVMEARDQAAGRALAAKAAERLPGPAALPPEFARLPAKGRLPGSERYVRKDALGHRALTNVTSADYRIGEAVITIHLADLATPQQAKQAWQKLWQFEQQTGKNVRRIARVGEECFAARDSSYGEFVAALRGRFVVIGASEKASRKAVVEMVKSAVTELR